MNTDGFDQRPFSSIVRQIRLLAVAVVICTLLTPIASCEDLPLGGALDTKQVQRALQDPSYVVVDTRCSEAFAGWALDGIRRGGHIPGAVDFSARWLEVSSPGRDPWLKEALDRKGIHPKKKVVLYDANGEDHPKVARFLAQHGFDQIHRCSLQDWVNDPELPLRSYPAYGRLVPPQIVAQLIDGGRPQTFENTRRLLLMEASWGGESASYAKGHVPGSFHINTDAFEPPPAWMLGDASTLTRFAREHGLNCEDTILISSENPMAAHRTAIVLEYMGVRDVRVLSGGLAAWQRAGYAVETERRMPPPPREFGGRIPMNPRRVDTLTDIRAWVAGKADFQLVDVRSWQEFTGESTGYSYCSRAGRIPGAIFGHGGRDGVHVLDFYRNLDDTMRNGDEILAMWQSSAIESNRRISFMCGSGWRSAEVLNYALVLGMDQASIYSNGWIEWSNDPKNPTEKSK